MPQVGVMVTDGGPHPPEKWAEQTGLKLVDIIQLKSPKERPNWDELPEFEQEQALATYERALKEKPLLAKALEVALVGHHATVQKHECDKIVEHGAARLMHQLTGELDHPHDPSSALEEAIVAVSACTATTMFAAHYRRPSVQAFVKALLGRHFATAMHIERSWHADRNPEDPHAKAFRAQHQAPQPTGA